MQGVNRRTSKDNVSVLREFARTFVSFTLLTAVLISGTALVSARPAQATQQPHIRLRTSSFDRLNYGDVAQTDASFSAVRAPTGADRTVWSTRTIASPLLARSAAIQDVIYPDFALEIGPGEELVNIPEITADGTISYLY
jgi:hypothetical protein